MKFQIPAFRKKELKKDISEWATDDWFTKGFRAQVVNNLPEACSCYEKAIESDPSNSCAYYNWGIALSGMAKTDLDRKLYLEGIDKFRTAIKLNPYRADVCIAYVNSLFALARMENNIRYYFSDIEELISKIESMGKIDAGYYNRACLHSILNEKEKALHYLEKSLKVIIKNKNHPINGIFIENDEDLENIKGIPGFKILLERYFSE